ncbi:spermidine synthase [Aurantimicrobium sp. MWH-Uga1]|uniref:spermidine synthase n=1 Tax=Aurantimicrobium sp. MWH-Uga1 TaxID=2079575 RepID=UPI000DEDCD96|nr:fused MFS/spermidine synthase [Aurantimicrobium sp. MWH-Uga1]AXE53867.1 spermidine synthase [Aurantimicrobium sp. MWH-Uga1]
MATNPTITLKSSGLRATIEPDPYQDGAFILDIDGTPQSHVFIDDPSELFFEYIRRIGHVLDQVGKPGQPITAVHLGGGALTLPRYVEATRPGSRQQVIELEQDLIDFVREHLPLQKNANIRMRYGDAREVLGKLPSGLHGNVDVVIVDVFSGARTPAHVTSVEFYTEAAKLLAPSGVLIVNVADGPGLAFARGQAATLNAVLPHVIALAETQVLKGRRFGNVVLVGTQDPAIGQWLPRLLAGGPHPAKAVEGAEMKQFIGSAPIVLDTTAIASPTPNKTIFQISKK